MNMITGYFLNKTIKHFEFKIKGRPLAHGFNYGIKNQKRKKRAS